MTSKFFMHRIKIENDTVDKGIEVHEQFESALSSYHAYLGAYAYNNPKFPDVSYVQCLITDMDGSIVAGKAETWKK